MNYNVYAQVIGLTVLAVSIGIFANLSHTKKMAAQMINSSVGLLLGGIVPTMLGAWVITQHNLWADFWSMTVTVIGWIIFSLGLFRLWFVDTWIALLKANIKYLPTLFALFGLLAGLLLCYIGFIADKL